MVQDVKEAGAAEQALADCLAETLMESGFSRACGATHDKSMSVYFNGDCDDGERALALVETLPGEAGYGDCLMQYEMCQVAHKEPHQRRWQLQFMPSGFFDEIP